MSSFAPCNTKYKDNHKNEVREEEITTLFTDQITL